MKVLLVEPGQEAREAEIGGSLADMQKTVGGSIQAVYPYEDLVVLVCHEEGKLLGMPVNRGLHDENGQLYDIVAGPFFICGLGEDDFTGLSPELMEKYKAMFLEPELPVRIDGELMMVKKDLPKPPETPRKAPESKKHRSGPVR